MKPIIYEDEHGSWDAVDVKNLIWEHGELEKQLEAAEKVVDECSKLTKDISMGG